MGEYFRGWRRKFGCVLLFLAVAFTGGWIRSLKLFDLFGWENSSLVPVALMSTDGTVCIVTQIPIAWDYALPAPDWITTEDIAVDEWESPIEWHFRWRGLGYATTLAI
jgi:hypothetical protein